MIIVRLFCPFELAADRFVMMVDVVFVMGIAATAAAFVVASTIGINFSVVICVEFSKMLGIMRIFVVENCPVVNSLHSLSSSLLVFFLFLFGCVSVVKRHTLLKMVRSTAYKL